MALLTPKYSNMYEQFIILFPTRQANIFILKSLETYTTQLKASHTVLLFFQFIQSGSQSTNKGLNCPFLPLNFELPFTVRPRATRPQAKTALQMHII